MGLTLFMRTVRPQLCGILLCQDSCYWTSVQEDTLLSVLIKIERHPSRRGLGMAGGRECVCIRHPKTVKAWGDADSPRRVHNDLGQKLTNATPCLALLLLILLPPHPLTYSLIPQCQVNNVTLLTKKNGLPGRQFNR